METIGVWRERHEAKIVCEVKSTGTTRDVTVVWPTHSASVPTRSAVAAAAVVVTHGSLR